MNKLLIFLLGIFAAFSALIVQIIVIIIFPSLNNITSLEKFGHLMLIAIFSEELLKFALLWKIFNNFQKQTNLFLTAFILGIGFATTEIVFNLYGNSLLNWHLLFSYLGLLLIQLLTCTFYGLYFFRQKKAILWQSLVIFSIGLLVHFFFNLSVFYEINILLLNLILFILLIILMNSYFLAKKVKIN